MGGVGKKARTKTRGLPYWIAWRYVFARKANRFISFISLFSIIGIALGVAVIITVLSVMNGFRVEIQDKILNFTSHGELTSFAGRIDDWQALPFDALRDEGVINYAPMIETQAMLSSHSFVRGVYVRGILPELEADVSGLEDAMTDGKLSDLQDGAYRVILGEDLANYLGLRIGDKVSMLTHSDKVTPLGTLPRIRRFTVAGLFKIGMSQYDRYVALISLGDAQTLMSYKNEGRVDSIHFSVADAFTAPLVTHKLRARLGADYFVSDWTQNHRSFFRALEIEKTVLGILLTLIIAIAAFNIVTTLIMLVTEKQHDIAILKTVGMTPKLVSRIFTVHGCMLGIAGTFFGIILGVVLTHFLQPLAKLIEWISGRPVLSGDVYPISEVPAQLLLGDVVVVVCIAFVLTLIATIYPARRAARLAPADTLKQT